MSDFVTAEHAWRSSILTENSSIREAIANLDKTSMQIILVIDQDGVFKGTISDGDIRRGLITGLTIKDKINLITNEKPIVVTSMVARDIAKQLMIDNKVWQIPVVDEQKCLVGLHLWDQLVGTIELPNVMVIMAGGMGKRLLPHTENCPKPMLTIHGKPMLEHIINRAKSEGFRKFILSINYLGHMVKDYFGDGDRWGVHINYVCEEKPLGTAGALRLISPLPVDPFVVTNGDVISEISYRKILEFHQERNVFATMAVRVHELKNPYGVVRTDGFDLVGFEEKPTYRDYINAGIYILNPKTLEVLTGEYCDMPTLFDRLRQKDKRTLVYPMHEAWLDVGRPDDLHLANTSEKTVIE
jgi:dTDP-glucose pyrophosphorylase